MDSDPPQPIDFAQSPVDASWLLHYTDEVAKYAQELWAWAMKVPFASRPVCHSSIDASVRDEVEHLVTIVIEAVQNQCRSYSQALSPR